MNSTWNFNPTSFIVCSWTIIALVIVFKAVALFKSTNAKSVRLHWIWLLGLISFLSGLLIQLIHIRSFLVDVAQNGTLQADMIANSLAIGYNYTIAGLIIFTISLICWGVLKSKANK